MIDFSKVTGITIPEGVVAKIEAGGVVLWNAKASEPIVLEVEKITSDTYANDTTYSGEKFILLQLLGTNMEITYGGLTKTATSMGSLHAIVHFGTYNGKSDNVETPSNGTLTITGCSTFRVGHYNNTKSSIVPCNCVTDVSDFGSLECLGLSALKNCAKLTSVVISENLTSIGTNAFGGCTGLTSVVFENTSGWYVTETVDGDASTGTAVNVSDPANNVTLLTETYVGYYWYRS